MDEFERDRSITQSQELESVMERVLTTGRNSKKGELNQQNLAALERHSLSHYSNLGSRRSMSHQSKRSYKSGRLSQERISVKSRGSVRSSHSKLSRKSLRSIQDSLNHIRKSNSRGSHKNGSTIVRDKKAAKNIPDLGAEVNNVTKLRTSINTKLNTIVNDPSYDKFYRNGALLSLPPVHLPVVSLIDPGRVTFVANNDSHSKESNFGYSRNKFGGFYNH